MDSMAVTHFILAGMLALSVVVPFVALYAVSRVRMGQYATHARIQKRLFWACIAGAIILEVQIRLAGGSGNFLPQDAVARAPFLKPLLLAHVVGAVLTYLAWALQLFKAARSTRVAGVSPGHVPAWHRPLGYFTIAGLFYTAITAVLLFVYAYVQ